MMLAVLGDSKYLTDIKGRDLPVLGGLANLLGHYIVAPRLVNTVSVAVQRGLNDCHTFGYQFLQ